MKFVSQNNLKAFTSKMASWVKNYVSEWVKNYVSEWFQGQKQTIIDTIYQTVQQNILPEKKIATIRKGYLQIHQNSSFRVNFTEPMPNPEYAVVFMDYGDDYFTVKPTVYSRDVNGFWARLPNWDLYVIGAHECMYMAIGETN